MFLIAPAHPGASSYVRLTSADNPAALHRIRFSNRRAGGVLLTRSLRRADGRLRALRIQDRNVESAAGPRRFGSPDESLNWGLYCGFLDSFWRGRAGLWTLALLKMATASVAGIRRASATAGRMTIGWSDRDG